MPDQTVAFISILELYKKLSYDHRLKNINNLCYEKKIAKRVLKIEFKFSWVGQHLEALLEFPVRKLNLYLRLLDLMKSQ